MSKRSPKNRIVMLGTALHTKGGISAVVSVLRNVGLLADARIDYIATHCDGGKLAKIAIFLSALTQVTARLLLRRVSLLHVHTASRASFWRKSVLMWQAFLFRVPVIVHLHGGEFRLFYEQETNTCTRWLIAAVFRRAGSVVVLSESWRTWVLSAFPGSRVSVIHNPVPICGHHPFESRERWTLLSLGRLGKGKGTYDLIEAVSVLAHEHRNLRLVLGGDGELEKAARYARKLGVSDQVEILGWVGGVEKEVLLSRSSIYVLPSYNEGLPMSILEAMAAGMPVVTTPVGGIPEAVRDGVEGFLINPGDRDALTKCLATLLRDMALRRTMGEAARKRVEEVFAAPVVAEQISNLYERLRTEELCAC